MRDQLIGEKVKELQRELETWVKTKHILQPGERLLFSLKVEKGPIVLQKDLNYLYEMDAKEFFLASRICDLDVPHRLASRISNCIKNDWHWNAERTEMKYRYENMRDFLAMYGSVADLLHIPNLGKKCVKEMVRVMRQSGFPLEGPKWKVD